MGTTTEFRVWGLGYRVCGLKEMVNANYYRVWGRQGLEGMEKNMETAVEYRV